MKLFLKATTFLSLFPLLSRASLVSPSTSSDISPSIVTSVAGSIGPHHVSIQFRAPCEECSVGLDEQIEFNLDIEQTKDECSAANIKLNGIPLSSKRRLPEDASAIINSDLRLSAKLSSGLGEREFPAAWSLVCLEEKVSYLEVRLHRDGELQQESVAGFSASFKQSGQPTILKLDVMSPSSHKLDFDQDVWVSPPASESLVIVPTLEAPLPPGIPLELQQEYRRLREMKAEAGYLHDQIKDAEADIMLKLWDAEFGDCSTWRCYLMTAFRDAPIFAKLIAHHFRHHSRIDADFFKAATHRNCSDKATPATPSPINVPDVTVEAPSTPEPPVDPLPVTEPETPEPPSPPHGHSGGPPSWAHHGPPPWVKEGKLPPWGEGPPPWVKDGTPPPWGKGPPPWARPGFHTTSDQRPPWAHHNNPHVGPTSLDAAILAVQQQWKYRLIAAIASLMTVVLFTGCLFACVRRRIRRVRDPRRRAERAARYEERATKRAYKKAACKHRWRTLVQSLWRRTAVPAYEEKDGLLRSTESNDDSVVGEQIGNLRAAHYFIGELMRADEGHARARAQRPSELDVERASVRSETLPAYSTTAPPDYDIDVAGDISVIDGFTGYTPSGTDETPESSVVDCSPRMSFETQRTTFTRISRD